MTPTTETTANRRASLFATLGGFATYNRGDRIRTCDLLHPMQIRGNL